MIALIREPSGRLRFDHYSPSPIVYLDHGPQMAIAEHHLEDFAAPLLRRKGTLAFSGLHLLELADVSDRTAKPIESLLSRLWPSIAFLEVSPDVVIAEEEKLRLTDTGILARERRAPHLDDAMLEIYWEKRKPGSYLPDLAAFVNVFRDSEILPKLRAEWSGAVGQIIDRIRQAGIRYRDDPESQKAIAKPIKGPSIRLPTRYVNIAAGRYIAKNGIQLATPNHVRDFFHTVVAVSCCDYVVLDTNWKEAARQIQDEVRAAGLLTHEAHVFGVKEIPRFLHRLATDG